MEIVRFVVGGVTCWVGASVQVGEGFIRLGTISTRCWLSDDVICRPSFVVVADLEEVISKLAMPGTRSVWERDFRYSLVKEDAFLEILPRNIKQVFVVRLNATVRLLQYGWRDISIDLTKSLKKLVCSS